VIQEKKYFALFLSPLTTYFKVCAVTKMAGGFSQPLDKAPNLTTNYNESVLAPNNTNLCRRFVVVKVH